MVVTAFFVKSKSKYVLSLMSRWVHPVQGINKAVEIIECQQSSIDLDRILGIKAFSLDKLMSTDPTLLVRI
jgi:G3E family GTPase